MNQRSESNKPTLLYVTPVFPAVSEYGLAMRAGVILEALSAYFSVHLLVIPIYDPGRKKLSDALLPYCHNIDIIPISEKERLIARAKRWVHKENIFKILTHSIRFARAAEKIYDEHQFPFLYVFRLYMAPLLKSCFNKPSLREKILDLDDIESITGRRMAELYRSNGETRLAIEAENQAMISQQQEETFIPQFDNIAVCSEEDREILKRDYPGQKISVFPNVLRSVAAITPPELNDTFRLLFVGNLNYYPNRDGLRFFIEQILPQVRANASRKIEFHIVGSGKWDGVAQYQKLTDCHFHGFVPDLSPYYQQANCVVVPLRAGGGTRIKVLEAFCYQRPVISTSIGAEGIAATHEKELLIADSADAFTRQCCRLMNDANTARALSHNALALFQKKYTLEVLVGKMATMVSAVRA